MAQNNRTIMILLSIIIVLLVAALGIVFLKGGIPGGREDVGADASQKAEIIEMLPVTVNVSSTLPDSYGFSYTAEKSFDGNEFTWWTPNGDYYGQWINYHFGQPQKLCGIKILNGSHYPNFSNGGYNYGDLYYQNAILTEAVLEFSDGSKRNITLKVYDGMQTIEFPEVVTSSVKFVCKGIVPGQRWQDVCISEFRGLVARPTI